MALSLRRLWMPRCFPFEFERINAKPLVELENQNDFSDLFTPIWLVSRRADAVCRPLV
jgi:hypothetical protein